MKLPAVAIAAAFAGGIALGLYSPAAQNASGYLFVTCFSALCFLLFAGILLVSLHRLVLAAMASVLIWVLLGALGASIEIQPRASDHITALVDTARIDLKAPLRWHGKLRDEPARLPWGSGCDVELSGVDYQGKLLTARGGLRLSFAPRGGEQTLPELHAGDEVAVLAQARRPQLFRDDGAFNRREYLAQQSIDLVATLRAPELIERVSAPLPTVGARVARARRALR
jgi:hypothetical protein